MFLRPWKAAPLVLQHTATCCTTLHHTAPHCTTLQHTATHCNTLQHTATRKSGFEMFWKLVLKNLRPFGAGTLVLQHIAAHCNAPQHTATHRNTLQYTATNTHKRSQDVLKTLRASTDAMFRRAPTNQRTPNQNSLSSVGIDSFVCVPWLMCDTAHVLMLCSTVQLKINLHEIRANSHQWGMTHSCVW